MIEDDVFYTETMAKIFDDQGKYEKAARIYQYLLRREPDRQDLLNAISELEKKRFGNNIERLIHLFIQWIDLLITSNELKKLKKLQSHLNDRQ
ncbi:MAG: hypothetical protein JSV38_01615 [Desulfobacterales bacterium]|nr:MAG: hypothetical protein JSV38_01615 [Desulfobacterales bacterium]